MVGWQLGVTQQSKYIPSMHAPRIQRFPLQLVWNKELHTIKLSSLHTYGVLMIC